MDFYRSSLFVKVIGVCCKVKMKDDKLRDETRQRRGEIELRRRYAPLFPLLSIIQHVAGVP